MMKLIQINVMKVWGMPKVNQVLRMALISLNILINMKIKYSIYNPFLKSNLIRFSVICQFTNHD